MKTFIATTAALGLLAGTSAMACDTTDLTWYWNGETEFALYDHGCDAFGPFDLTEGQLAQLEAAGHCNAASFASDDRIATNTVTDPATGRDFEVSRVEGDTDRCRD